MLVVIHVLLHCHDLKIIILFPVDLICGKVNEIVAFRIFFIVDVIKDMKVISCCIFFFLTLE